MENKVKNAYAAYRIDNNDSFGSFISVGSAATGKSIAAFDLWFYVIDCGDTLISQKNGFSLGIQQQGFVLKHPRIPKTLCKQNNMERLTAKTWHNLYMGYNDKEIQIYVDGILFWKKTCSISPFTSDEFMLGEDLTGYIRSFRIYDCAIGEEDYKNYCLASVYNEKTMPHMTAFIDFTKGEISNLCPGNVDVRIHEGCSPVNLVSVYCPSLGNGILFPKSAQNTEKLFTDTFSIYNKLYIRPSEQELHVLAAYGESSEDDYVEIFGRKSGENMKFGIRLGNQEYLFRQEIGSFQWADVLAVVQGKTVTAYINGVEEKISMTNGFKRTRKGDFRIGGKSDSPQTSSAHYLHTTAVFQKALTAKDAADFMENHPFLFEDDLTVLVRFEDNSALECVSGEIFQVDDKNLFLAENTVDALPDSPYQYRLAYTAQPPSELSRWKAELFVGAHLGFMKGTFGLVPRPGKRSEAVRDAMVRYYSNHAEVLAQVSELYTKPLLKPEEVLQAVSGKDKTTYYKIYQGMDGVLESEAALSAPTALMAGAAAASLYENLPAYIAIGLSILLTIGMTILTLVNQLRRKKPDVEEGQLQLLSVCFQHEPDDHAYSAIRCRNHAGVISGAEWTSKDKSVGSAVYIADEIEKVKIKIRFKITNQSAESAGPCEVYIGADVVGGESRLFDGFSYQKGGLTANQEYEAVLECKKDAHPTADFSCTEVELFWGGRVNKSAAVLPNTKTKLYVIPTAPCPPIYLDKGCDEDFVAVEYLDIFSKLREDAQTENVEGGSETRPEASGGGQEESFGRVCTVQRLREITQELYDNRTFKYCGEGEFRHDTTKFLEQQIILPEGNMFPVTLMKFKERVFLREVKTRRSTPMAIECETYAVILCYLFQLHHVDARLVYMANVYRDDLTHIYEGMNFENICPAGQNAVQNICFQSHMLVEVVPQPNVPDMDETLVFDASMGIMVQGERRALAGYPFRGINAALVDRERERGTYRGTVVRNGTGAGIVHNRYFFTRT